MALFKEFVKKHGYGIVVAAVTFDGYRRAVLNDHTQNKLDQIKAEYKAMRDSADQKHREELDQNIAETNAKAKEMAVMDRYQTIADEHLEAVKAHEKDPSSYRQAELERITKKLHNSYDEIKELSFFDYISSFYNMYTEYLDSLTPDKIVCIFNIILGGLTLSSFFSILSIMLSEKIINRIKFLERYPRILALLKLRIHINKTIVKFYLFMHFFIILITILSNTYMFFL